MKENKNANIKGVLFCAFGSLLDIILTLVFVMNIQEHIIAWDFHNMKIREIIRWYDYLGLFFIFLFDFFARYFVYKSKNIKSKSEMMFVLIFSVFLTYAYSFELYDSTFLLTRRNSIWLLVFILFANISLVSFLSSLLRSVCERMSLIHFRLPSFLDNHICIFSVILILFCWLPIIIIRFPAAFEFDAYHQLMAIKGDFPLTQHWPVFYSAMIGGIYCMFNMFFSNNLSIFFTSLVFAILCALCFSYSISIQKRIGINDIWIMMSIMCYSVLPIFSRYTTALVKDSLYACVVLVFISKLAEIVFIEKCKVWELYCWSFFVFLLRNNGRYVLFGVIIAVLFVGKRNKYLFKKVLLPIFLSCCLGFITVFILTCVGIPKGSIKEMFSIPFQQSARYVIKNEDKMSIEEKNAISKVLDYESIKENYNPRLSDPVKGTYHAKGFEDLKCYFLKAWIPGLLADPLVYFEATFNNTYGFFYPLSQESTNSIYINVNFDSDVKYFSATPEQMKVKTWYHDVVQKMERSIVFGWLCNCGVNSWLFIWLLFYNRKEKIKLILAPSVVSALVCIASPTFVHNGLRYALPIIFCNVFLFSLVSYAKSSDIKK